MNHNVAFDAYAVQRRALSLASGALDFKTTSRGVRAAKSSGRRVGKRRSSHTNEA